ncbi:MAG: hypothetical protein ACI865_002395 [Flavobacteriaceae bacterium]|jgi:hypothetical protein
MIKILATSLTTIMATAVIAQLGSAIDPVIENGTPVETLEVTSVADNVMTLDKDLLVLGGQKDESLSVGIGTALPSSLASLELGDQNKGFLLNRMRQSDITIFEMSLGIAEEGMMVYNIDRGNLLVWNGTRWIAAGIHTVALEEDLLLVNDDMEVDLSKYKDNTDEQSLTTASLDGNLLTIGIENGNDVSIDLSPILAQYEDRIAALEESAGIPNERANLRNVEVSRARLYQNNPNPMSHMSSIKYMVPVSAHSAQLIISNSMGSVLVTKQLKPNGQIGKEMIDAGHLASGVYYSTLIVDGQKIDTKKMIVD